MIVHVNFSVISPRIDDENNAIVLLSLLPPFIHSFTTFLSKRAEKVEIATKVAT